MERRHSTADRRFFRVPSAGAGRSTRYRSENLLATRCVLAGAALAAGVVSIAAIPVLAMATLLLGAVVLALGLISWRALRADPSPRGARPFLVSFILGIGEGMFLSRAVRVLPMLLCRFFGWATDPAVNGAGSAGGSSANAVVARADADREER